MHEMVGAVLESNGRRWDEAKEIKDVTHMVGSNNWQNGLLVLPAIATSVLRTIALHHTTLKQKTL